MNRHIMPYYSKINERSEINDEHIPDPGCAGLKMKINEVIPIIDDVVAVYQKNRAILVTFGETDVDKIIGLVNTLKGIMQR